MTDFNSILASANAAIEDAQKGGRVVDWPAVFQELDAALEEARQRGEDAEKLAYFEDGLRRVRDEVFRRSQMPQYTVVSSSPVRGYSAFGLFDSREAAEKYCRFLELKAMKQRHVQGGYNSYYEESLFRVHELRREVQPPEYRAEDVDLAIRELEMYFEGHVRELRTNWR